MYTYSVIAIPKVIDGDTFDFDLDLGFYARLRVRVRLAGIDTYEVYGKNAHPKGIDARDFAADWMRTRLTRGHLAVHTFKLSPDTPTADGSFGRWMGEVFDLDDQSLLADALRDAGYAEE